MIEKYFDEIEKVLIDDPLVVITNFNRYHTNPKTAYIRGKALFIDSSSANIFQHIQLKEKNIIITNYRYNYMNSESKLIFRYDNAPHYKDLSTFPHHKHIPTGVEEARMPDIKDLLTEISKHIIRKLLTY